MDGVIIICDKDSHQIGVIETENWGYRDKSVSKMSTVSRVSCNFQSLIILIIFTDNPALLYVA